MAVSFRLTSVSRAGANPRSANPGHRAVAPTLSSEALTRPAPPTQLSPPVRPGPAFAYCAPLQRPRGQHDNPPGAKFCGECAAPLAATCPSCGASNPPGNKFCGQCATPLRAPSTAPAAAPDSYTPRHLAARILRSEDGLA